MLASPENLPLLEELLAEQQRLDTPVARFAVAHEGGRGEQVRAQLIPLTAPGPGEQYAFEVDLDACSGCKSCVAACHSLNGLDEEETWRDVGLLVSGDRRHPFSQTVTTACHHCTDPACLNGCPVLAYEKDPVTGIVRHLDDQCIGCSYCILKCPYDVPKYSARRGIVRKCDMCQGRLAHGEAPACAEACPTQAIRIVTVTKTPDRHAIQATIPEVSPESDLVSPFLPAAPHPSYTQPTTRYVSRRGLPTSLVAADEATLRPQPAHWPLVALLMFMPMAVGCGLADKILALPTVALAVTSWVAGTVGLAFSVAHLGQPRRAWRIFLGLRRSWLSREAVVFGMWYPLATLYALGRVRALPISSFSEVLRYSTAACGVLGLFCSAKIYADTRRDFWQMKHTAPRFFGSAVVLGIASALAAAASCYSANSPLTSRLAIALAVAVVAKLLFETQALEPLKGNRDELTPALKTARLLAGPLRPVNELRAACGVLGGIVLPVIVATGSGAAWLAWPALAVVAAGEFLERSLFFRAVVAPKMPGVPGGN